jgi:hypothetical protein
VEDAGPPVEFAAAWPVRGEGWRACVACVMRSASRIKRKPGRSVHGGCMARRCKRQENFAANKTGPDSRVVGRGVCSCARVAEWSSIRSVGTHFEFVETEGTRSEHSVLLLLRTVPALGPC